MCARDNVLSDEVPLYKHRRLDGARTIRLLRCHRGQELHCVMKDARPNIFSLVERSLDEPDLKYIAISYAWGTEDHTASLTLREGPNHVVLKLTPNACEAINTIVSHPASEADVLYWMDQICIDQACHEEKSQQVQMMGVIYWHARRLIVWLGPEDMNTMVAYDFLREIESVFPHTESIAWDEHQILASTHARARKLVATSHGSDPLPPTNHAGWQAVASLLQRSWFSRLWTFQEAVLSYGRHPYVYCGRHHAPLTTLIRAALLLGNDLHYDGQTRTSRDGLFDISVNAKRLEQRQRLRLYTLLEANGSRSCRDSRDRVYALLGLVNDNTHKYAIQVHYSMPTNALYTTIARLIIRSSQTLRFCSGAPERIYGGDILDLPTWVPNWTAQSLTEMLDYQMPHMAWFRASRLYRHQQTNLEELGNVLKVRGRVVDYVHLILETEQLFRQPSEADQHVQKLRNVILSIYEAVRSILESLSEPTCAHMVIQTVTAGGFYQVLFRDINWPPDAWSQVMCHTMMKVILKQREGTTLVDDFQEQWLSSLWRQVDRAVFNRRVAILKDSGLALVPWYTEAGDLIAILHGLSTPMVLRRTGTSYKMIGPCFVDCMMYGEKVDWAEEDADTFDII